MSDYRAYAKDLHDLAYLFTEAADDLPEPKFDLPLEITVHVPELRDVSTAALALGVKVTDLIGYPNAEVLLGSVRLRFSWVAPVEIAESETRRRFAETMPDGWPGSVLKPGYTPALDAS